jgi:hypothetical protein
LFSFDAKDLLTASVSVSNTADKSPETTKSILSSTILELPEAKEKVKLFFSEKLIFSFL